MTTVQEGNTVQVHYTGRLEDGTVFDTSAHREPLEFTVGANEVIPGFEEAVVGMNAGETKTVEISHDKAYGPHQDELMMQVDRGQLPPEIDPQEGQKLQVRQQDGQIYIVTVTDVNESQVTLDANHPLAGQDLTFDIQVIGVK